METTGIQSVGTSLGGATVPIKGQVQERKLDPSEVEKPTKKSQSIPAFSELAKKHVLREPEPPLSPTASPTSLHSSSSSLADFLGDSYATLLTGNHLLSTPNDIDSDDQKMAHTDVQLAHNPTSIDTQSGCPDSSRRAHNLIKIVTDVLRKENLEFRDEKQAVIQDGKASDSLSPDKKAPLKTSSSKEVSNHHSNHDASPVDSTNAEMSRLPRPVVSKAKSDASVFPEKDAFSLHKSKSLTWKSLRGDIRGDTMKIKQVTLEQHFAAFREQTIGCEDYFDGPEGTHRIVYADWTASGRLYEPIEHTLSQEVGPFVANTHTEASFTGTSMTKAYQKARDLIKQHVNADKDDVLIAGGAGMTALINKLQRMLGLRLQLENPEVLANPEKKPVVFVTHMEHHSNQTSWLETIADVVVVPPDYNGLVSPVLLHELVKQYEDRPLKIGSFTACSNVTGIITPYHELARVMHKRGGFCIVDFAASAPYVDIDMHPEGDPEAHLDALIFSPHKFLGGPGSSGVLVISKNWYQNSVPDCPGGGTVEWTNPWGEHRYIANPEAREDGGTPPFLQTMRTALAIRLKETMGVANIQAREAYLLDLALPSLRKVPGLHILDDHVPAQHRLCIISFYVENIHYNLMVRLLNDRFGIQVRGGCSCAGTYGHYVMDITQEHSKRITDQIDSGDNSTKPGWVRLSLHPTMSDREVEYILQAIDKTVKWYTKWGQDYSYDPNTNEFTHRKDAESSIEEMVENWFEIPTPTGSSKPHEQKKNRKDWLFRVRRKVGTKAKKNAKNLSAEPQECSPY